MLFLEHSLLLRAVHAVHKQSEEGRSEHMTVYEGEGVGAETYVRCSEEIKVLFTC